MRNAPTEKSGSGADDATDPNRIRRGVGSYAGICAETYVGNVFGIWDQTHRRILCVSWQENV